MHLEGNQVIGKLLNDDVVAMQLPRMRTQVVQPQQRVNPIRKTGMRAKPIRKSGV